MQSITQTNPSEQVENLVVGAGPAGVQLAYYLAKEKRDYLVLESGNRPGSFFEEFPRHRKLISVNKVYTGTSDPDANLRWDWNSLLSDEGDLLFKNHSKDYFPNADALLEYLSSFSNTFSLNISYGVRVSRIDKQPGAYGFSITTESGRTLSAKRVIMATGVSNPYIPEIPGIDLTENYVQMSVDPECFQNQSVLILGKGNSAFETADNLIGTTKLIHVASPNPLKLAWKTHFVGHLRAVNNNFLDTYQLKSQNAVLDCTVNWIRRNTEGKFEVNVSYTHAADEAETLIYDRVLACTGFRFDGSLFTEQCRPELMINDRFPKMDSSWQSVNIPELYFAGTITQSRDFKKSTSGFIHGFRYNVRTLSRILASRYYGVPSPSRTIGSAPKSFASSLINRINQTSGLWQQFAFLGDLIVINDTEAQIYEEVPVDFIHEEGFGYLSNFYILTMEFGPVQEDPFNINRHPDPERASDSAFLHPVIRHYLSKELVGTHHMLENLYGEWLDQVAHVEPLQNFLKNQSERDLRDSRNCSSMEPIYEIQAVGAIG